MLQNWLSLSQRLVAFLVSILYGYYIDIVLILFQYISRSHGGEEGHFQHFCNIFFTGTLFFFCSFVFHFQRHATVALLGLVSYSDFKSNFTMQFTWKKTRKMFFFYIFYHFFVFSCHCNSMTLKCRKILNFQKYRSLRNCF